LKAVVVILQHKEHRVSICQNKRTSSLEGSWFVLQR
jgi:hypothetical protein